MNKVFCGYNLKTIREYKGISISELSKLSYISESDMLAFESGKKTPDLELIMRLCSALGCSRGDLKRVDSLGEFKSNVFFRNQGFVNKKEEISYAQKCIMVYRIHNFLKYYLKLPRMDNINFKNEDASKLAKNLRTFWDLGDGPLCNMVGLLETKGFTVCNVNPGKQKVQAFGQILKFEDDSAYIISIGNDNKSAARRNYDLAHELAHFMLHEEIDISNLSKSEFSKIEEEAIDFVCEFLLPKESFYEDLIEPNDLEFYIQLKSKWIVPMWLLIKRAYQLGAISARKYEYFIKEMKNNGWDKKEPLDANIKISNPVLLKMGIEVLLDNKIMNNVTLLNNLKDCGVFVDSYEIEQLVNMKKGTLSSEEISKKSNILTLKR